MDDRPLATVIATTLHEVAELEERDRAGRAHAEVRARLAYVHQLLGSLEAELGALRREATGDPAHERVWRDTTAALRARAPASLSAPAAALVGGDLDLLRLVEYTSASITLVQERRFMLSRLASLNREGGNDRTNA